MALPPSPLQTDTSGSFETYEDVVAFIMIALGALYFLLVSDQHTNANTHTYIYIYTFFFEGVTGGFARRIAHWWKI